MSAAGSQPQGLQSHDEAAVRTLYEQLMDGWNSGSGEAFAAPSAVERLIGSIRRALLAQVNW